MMQGGIIALTLTVLILPGFVAAQSGDNIGWNTVVAIGWTTEHANEFFETLFGSKNYTKQEVSLSIAGNMSGSNSCKTNYHFGSTGQRSYGVSICKGLVKVVPSAIFTDSFSVPQGCFEGCVRVCV